MKILIVISSFFAIACGKSSTSNTHRESEPMRSTDQQVWLDAPSAQHLNIDSLFSDGAPPTRIDTMAATQLWELFKSGLGKEGRTIKYVVLGGDLQSLNRLYVVSAWLQAIEQFKRPAPNIDLELIHVVGESGTLSLQAAPLVMDHEELHTVFNSVAYRKLGADLAVPQVTDVGDKAVYQAIDSFVHLSELLLSPIVQRPNGVQSIDGLEGRSRLQEVLGMSPRDLVTQYETNSAELHFIFNLEKHFSALEKVYAEMRKRISPVGSRERSAYLMKWSETFDEISHFAHEARVARARFLGRETSQLQATLEKARVNASVDAVASLLAQPGFIFPFQTPEVFREQVSAILDKDLDGIEKENLFHALKSRSLTLHLAELRSVTRMPMLQYRR